MRKLFIIIFILLTVNSFAAIVTHYVSATATGSGNGLSTGSPWNLAQLNAGWSSINAGDHVSLKRGDTFYGELVVNKSGSAGNPIIIDSYGSGAMPKILGSTAVTTWTNYSGNVWVSSNTVSNPAALQWGGQIFFQETNGSVTWGNIEKGSTGALSSEYDWTWSSNHIYIYSSINPNTKYLGIEVTQRLFGIDLNNKAYLTFDGLEIAYCGEAGIVDAYPLIALSGLNILNCKIHHMAVKGAAAGFGTEVRYSDMVIKGNEIYDCGRRGINLNVPNTTMRNVLVDSNYLYNGYHTTGIDLDGEGGSYDSVTISNNIIYDDPNILLDSLAGWPSNGMFIANQAGGTATNVFIHNNIIRNSTFRGIQIQNVQNVFIYNNTFYGVNKNVTAPGASIWVEGGTSIVYSKNNIVSNNTTKNNFYCFLVTDDAGISVTSNYNLFYDSIAGAKLVSWRGFTYITSQWNSYKSGTAQDANSVTPANPLFASLVSFNLMTGSPAINTGFDVGFGKTIGAVPSLLITPTINWTPASLTYPNGLGAGQLNAVAKDGATTVTGTMNYLYGAGYVGDVPIINNTVTFTPQDPQTYSSATKSVQITVNKGTVSISFSAPTLTQTWTGLPLAPTVITSPANVPYSILYNGIGATPIEPNSYSVTAATTDGNYVVATVSGTFTINKAIATFTITNTSQYYNGNPLVPFVTTNPANLTGVNIASPHTNPGTYSDVITLNNIHYQANPVTIPFVITTAGASMTITGYQNKFYTGGQISVVPVTNPAGLTYTVTYGGSATPPTNAGTYQVIATITQVGYSGSDTVSMTINKAPTTNTLTWQPIANVQEGTAITSLQLNAYSSIAGTFTYDFPVGYLLNAGVYRITGTFHPQDSNNYETSTIQNTLIVYGSPILQILIIHGKPYPLDYPQ